MRALFRAACPILFALLAAAAPAADLPRRASFGISMQQGPQASGRAVVDQVFPGQTAAALGIRTGDVIVEVGGKPVDGPPAVVAYVGTLTAGDPVDLKLIRAGQEIRLAREAIGRPRESYDGATVDYGAVPFRGGHLRDLLLLPDGVETPPILFLIQGFSCSSIEPPTPDHPSRRLGAELAARGIGYYRVEKPGVGDSVGTPACVDIDFATELDAFRSAYEHLVETRGVDADRIFMFGHSLGGLQAPLLAKELPPRGVAAYGTVLRNWADYHQALDTFQTYLFTGADPGVEAAQAEANRAMFRLYYFERQAPAVIAAAHPGHEAALRELLAWDGGERAFGRHYKFMQDLAHQPIVAAWRDTKSNVLSLYGESDVVALFDTDHRMIADIANWQRPGSGRYVEVAETDHGMTKVGDRTELRRKTIANNGTPPDGEFNPEVADILASWIKESMAKPPVRTQAGPTSSPNAP